LFDSLYRRHPVGGLLVWATESKSAQHRGDGPLAAGVVKLLLDGQQRMTSLYGVVRGRPPTCSTKPASSAPETGEQQAVFDLAWPEGLQEELSQPVPVLLNEEPKTVALASSAGFRVFTDVIAFKTYVEREVLSAEMV